MRLLRGLRVADIFRFLRYVLNPFRLVKWFFYFLFFSIILSFLTLSLVKNAHAAEWTPAKSMVVVDPSAGGNCTIFNSSGAVKASYVVTPQGCLDKASVFTSQYWTFFKWVKQPDISSMPITSTHGYTTVQVYNGATSYPPDVWIVEYRQTSGITKFICPPDGKPDFNVGPTLTENGQVCQKKPLTCLTGSIKETNVITGKEFCRPYCHGVAGNTLGEPGSLVTFFAGTIGSTTISCYGQCSVVSEGVSINSTQNPNVYNGIIKFTGQNCPLQVSGEDGNETVSGNVDQATSSDNTNNAQNNLQNSASSAISNATSGATGTANLNTVVDKIAETSNAEIKASSEQNAALGDVIENVGKDIQQAIKDSQTVGGAGASIGQMQTANAIKDGNAKLGDKLDAIKDAIDKQGEGEGEGEGEIPQVPTTIDADVSVINENPNNWAERNYATVLQAHAQKLQELPLYSGIRGFFNVSINGGKCPEFAVDIPSVNLPMVGSFGGGKVEYSFCETNMDLVLNIIRSVVMVLSTFFAVRYALE